MSNDMMGRDQLNRRDFHRLSAAALGGLIAGAAAGCGEDPSKSLGKLDLSPKGSDDSKAKSAAATKVAAAPVDQHACRGLNECKGKGRDHKNNCAGQGACYTVTHKCAGQNDCKYQGGCGGEEGVNACKGKGGCEHFPIKDDAWKKARVAFEARMKQRGKPVGQAPAPSKA